MSIPGMFFASEDGDRLGLAVLGLRDHQRGHRGGSGGVDMGEDAAVGLDEGGVAGHAHVQAISPAGWPLGSSSVEGEVVRRLRDQGIGAFPDHGVAIGKLVGWCWSGWLRHVP